MQPSEPSPTHPMRYKMTHLVRSLQKQITSRIESLEGPNGARFLVDKWTRTEGGEGISCIMQDGDVFEKGGVNISIVASKAPEGMLNHMRARKREGIEKGKNYEMFVAGISTVMHPRNPYVPTVHFNYRYFELREEGKGENEEPVAAWFGGGCDLTPVYLFEEDATHFHTTIKSACDAHDQTYYTRFKSWCDTYFHNTHRNEARGIGGIFFDDLEEVKGGKSKEELFAFVKSCGESFLEQYIPIVEKRMGMRWGEWERRWQQVRRGRYVEFNLVHDRGTKFGLATPGVRIESVLMSLPLTARWEYKMVPEKGSPEEKLVNVLQHPREWA
ncbi:Coproporphyrinogen-III oxidase [Rhizophlyctis rosea]|uniref:coproporphyrinogen oxidase n=1 Tax=Rhizophlyctis rosea TaxID=64517 RepID=A0AAD5SGV6_9FUNG|nr:Coproporphyrinogen-III oxidase [Rhizophlyctis rosea]